MRNYVLTVEGPGFTDTVRPPIDVSFSVSKVKQSSEPSTGTITVHNVSRERGDRWSKLAERVRLEAGTVGFSYGLLISGTVQEARWSGGQPESSVTLSVMDGANIVGVPISASFARGTSLASAIREVARQASLTVDAQGIAPAGSSAFPAPRTFFGSADNALRQMCAEFSLQYKVIDGKVVLARRGAPLAQGTVIISSQTGLVGKPELLRSSARPEQGTGMRLEQAVSFQTRLFPELIPGMRISIQSSVSGEFIVSASRHAGRYQGREWSTDVEAAKVATADPGTSS